MNVGLPKDVPWQGKTVFTGVFKAPVTGARRVSKPNVDGDGQGDRAGHGGVCHNCETTLIAGKLAYDPDPVEPPAEGSALICCSRPRDELVLDL